MRDGRLVQGALLAALVFGQATLFVTGCQGELTNGEAGIHLALSASTEGDRLILAGSPIDPAYRGSYANPGLLTRMTVTMFGDGRLVGVCTRDGGEFACVDVPFFSRVSFEGGVKLLRIWDVAGILVVEHRCGTNDPLCAATGGGCGESGDDVDGESCTPECTANEYGEGCFNGRDDDCDGLPDCADVDCLAKCLDQGGADGNDGGWGGTGDPPPDACPPPPSDTDCTALETWALDCFCTLVNDNLEQFQVDTVLDCSGFGGTLGPEDLGGTGWDYEGDIACRNDLIDDAEEGVGEFVEETACPLLEIEVHNWVSEADFSLRSRGYCGSSPLILDLAGDGISLTPLAGGVRFDLLGTGEPVACAWTQGDDALVVYDRDGDGGVAGAGELLGQVTGGRRHADGFAALATLDDNADGVVDARDAAWPSLRAWRDDGDGQAERGELTSLSSAGVMALRVRAERVTGPAAWDGRGNRVPLIGEFVRRGGATGRLVDAWFRYLPADQK